MSCLRTDTIYFYMEDGLSRVERTRVANHLAVCEYCRNALENRKVLDRVSRTLPQWETPPDFTRSVMARLFPQRLPLRSWLTAAGLGFSTVTGVLLLVFLQTGDNLGSLALQVSRGLLNGLHNLSIMGGKFVTTVSALFTVLRHLGQLIIKGFHLLTSVLNPEVQIILVTLTILLSGGLVIGVRRLLIHGERV